MSILDTLTPGDLTGGKRVAVTGTISEDGSVGEIGGISQKATSAKAAGAELFIVPACTRDDIKTECERELAKREGARRRPACRSRSRRSTKRSRRCEDAGGEPVDVAPQGRGLSGTLRRRAVSLTTM